ncbi:MIP family channel protein [Spizellomyces punctatus DAOM BR117]|uniref:MIP family channel protein n=1 Tax=Spizellomyces punctatus (strain DAOM BR117) TaxID=645134 RepID=A0A0L0HUE7_SPIPD|nr:MIP family channel protein [Spizellomyces punctatus DAOM BR117]KND04976.1 MIP family channel protein [Spizellomyces punctatus DAOM BR117]|eukprot:XP_016613015.1 MIP family channel protein [Spizellomyces punctatus DAOM BR117]
MSTLDPQESKETIVDMAPEIQDKVTHKNKSGHLAYIRHQFREELAELLGTFILIIFGNGVVAQVVLHNNKNGEYLSINIGWGLGVLFGIYASGGISGAHLNPAVTISNAIHKGFPWRKVPGYVIAQILGAFLAAAVIFGNYHAALDAFDGGDRQTLGPKATAGIFSTYPQPYLSTVAAFFSEFLGTAILMIGIYACSEAGNSAAPDGYGPIAVSLLVMAIGMALGSETGYAINPARDLGPRTLTAIAGWGSEPFTAYNHYFWIPIVGPIVGGVFGGYVFRALSAYKNSDEGIY